MDFPTCGDKLSDGAIVPRMESLESLSFVGDVNLTVRQHSIYIQKKFIRY